MHDIKKLIVCDLDGTLLNDKKEITAYTASVLIEAKKKGFHICYASGRCQQMMSIYADKIQGCDYIISCNGALAVSVKDRQVIYQSCMSRFHVSKIQKYLLDRSMDFTMYTVNDIYYSAYSPNLNKRMKDYEKLAEAAGYPVSLCAKTIDTALEFDDAVKLVAYEKDTDKLNGYIAWIESNCPEIYCESTGYGLMGTFSKAASKQAAVESIKTHMGITGSQVYVFGDFDNDLSMFACADNRIAMANAVPGLKAAATCITKSNEEDGVAVYLEKLLQTK